MMSLDRKRKTSQRLQHRRRRANELTLRQLQIRQKPTRQVMIIQRKNLSNKKLQACNSSLLIKEVAFK